MVIVWVPSSVLVVFPLHSEEFEGMVIGVRTLKVEFSEFIGNTRPPDGNCAGVNGPLDDVESHVEDDGEDVV